MSAASSSAPHPESIGKVVCERWKDVGENAALVRWGDLQLHLGLKKSSTRGILQAVVVWHLQKIECVVAPDPDWQDVQIGVGSLLQNGWTVTVLAPLNSLGSAHAGLGGTAASLQGWWSREDDQIHFTREESL